MSAELRIDVEWLDGTGVRTPELGATWCRLEIAVGGRPVTLVEDVRTRSTRRAIYCSAYSLAEWIATSWWALRSHVRTSVTYGVQGIRHETWRWHDARAASDGFPWPRLAIYPAGDAVEIVWAADTEPRGVVRYLTNGRVWLGADDLRHALAAFVDEVVAQLEKAGVNGTLLQDEWAAVADADEEEASFCDAAAALGLDPYSLGEREASAIERARDTIGNEIVRDLATATEPARFVDDLNWTAASLEALGSVSAPTGRVAELAAASNFAPHPDSAPPWRVGYERADCIRRALSVAAIDPVDLTGIVSVSRPVLGTNPALQGVAGVTRDVIRLVPARGLGRPPRRFLQGRALHSVLRWPSRPSLVSAVHTWEAQVERAFSAELLAPAKGLAAELSEKGAFVSLDEVQRLATHFRAPAAVVEHQLENQLQLMVAT